MDEMLAPVLELDAAAVAAAPLLGYRIVELSRPGEDGTVEVVRRRRVSQPWIEIENSSVTIDIKLFRVYRPLAGLLVKGSEESRFKDSLSGALADFQSRWAVSSQLQDRVSSSPSKALVVVVGDAEALVWREGMVIGAYEPLAMILKLLMADFSEESCQAYVHERPQSLISALRLLPNDVKSRYVPQANEFIVQAMHELAAQKRRNFPEAPRIEIKPSSDPRK